MITQLKLERFKCFSQQTIKLNKLALFAGGSATGKSTIIQALLLLRQAYLTGQLQRGELPLAGALASVGSARDVLMHGSSMDSIVFEVSNKKKSENFRCSYGIKDDQRGATILTGDPVMKSSSNLFSSMFAYLQAERLGPRLLYPMSNELSENQMEVGTQGEYTAHILNEYGEYPIKNIGLRHPDNSHSSLTNQVIRWMVDVVPDLEIETESIKEIDSVRIGLKNSREVNARFVRPTNTGFGISYTLPIVVAALMSEPDSLLIIENPEAHLHPKAQSTIGQFLARTAATGTQVILETHSDHILNGIRLAVYQKVLDANDVSIQFFTHNPKNKVISPKMDKDGRIDKEPDGFFDQIEKDLMALW